MKRDACVKQLTVSNVKLKEGRIFTPCVVFKPYASTSIVRKVRRCAPSSATYKESAELNKSMRRIINYTYLNSDFRQVEKVAKARIS